MKELSEELTQEIVEYYKQYKLIVREKDDLTAHNRDMKTDFMETHFDAEEVEVEDIKRIKKEITKYFNTILEINSGNEPLPEIKELRKSHLDFDYDVYADLMAIFKQISENNEKKEALNDKIEKDVYLPLVVKMGSPMDIIKGMFKLSYDVEAGKFPIALTVVDDYRKLVTEIEKLEG